MLNPRQFQDHVIDPTLKMVGLYSPEASDLLLGTALAESGLRALVQDGGPALGLYQMEPATHSDIWANFLAYRQELAGRIGRVMWARGDTGTAQLVANLAYATVMTRVHYLRVPTAIPKTAWEQAKYWSDFYNTAAGRGTIDHYLAEWRNATKK